MAFVKMNVAPFIQAVWGSAGFWRGIVCIAVVLIIALWSTRKFWDRLIFRSQITFEIPKESIRILPKPNANAYWWHMGTYADKPAMQISADFDITNITKYNILLTSAKMKNQKILGSVMVQDSQSQYHGRYDIKGGSTTDASVDFWILPPFKKKGESFKADIAITDQFGTDHWIRGVEFRYQ